MRPLTLDSLHPRALASLYCSLCSYPTRIPPLAEDVESEALASLVLNKLRGGLKIAAVKAPGFGDNRKANLQDIAELTGGTVVSEEVGLKLDTTTLEHLGSAKKITVSKDDTLIMHGGGSKDAIAERCAMIRDLVEATSSEYEKEKLQERLAKLSGGIAVIKVGGSSEVEMGEKKDRIVDALNATRAAVDEGIVPGGGVALLNASRVSVCNKLKLLASMRSCVS